MSSSEDLPVQIPDGFQPLGTSGTRLLEIERAKASFSPAELREYIYGNEYLERQARILPIVENEPAFDKSQIHYMSRGDKYRHGLKKEKRIVQLTREHGWSAEDVKVAEELIDMPAAFGLHNSMFLKTLRSQSNEEQQELFTKPAENFEIIGCYAQTELGHGSNVQGLETTATYRPETKSFIINTPGMSSMKWWIGGLGRTADHAVVMAQLYTPDGKNGKLVKRGPFPFVVPLRDRKTRELLPGRTVMDIGPKAGYPMTDNGTAIFNNVEIPHINFLAKFASVDPDSGRFTAPKHDKVAYGTMTFIRANIVQQARMILARSATVAIRYCAVRRQFADRDAPQTDDGRKPSESQVLNYLLVQARIFPPLVQAFALHYTGRAMMAAYNASQAALEEGDFSLLADVHASSSGLKSLSTIMASNAIEECRRACGGHGYSLAGGLASLYADYLPQVTWCGDSYMISQQTGRYLFKTMRAVLADRHSPANQSNSTAQYIRRYVDNPTATAPFKYAGDLSDPQIFVDAFAHRAAYLTATALRKRDVEKRTWNDLLIDIFRMSTAHSQYILVNNFAQAVMHDKDLASKPAVHRIMTTCFELFACYTMDAEASEFLSSGYLVPKQHELLRSRTHALLAELRPQAVPLVDAWGCPDYLLNSALGRADGNVYPALVRFAQGEPLNQTRFNVAVDEDEIEVGK
ncbi:acyl-CoA dehydrogenase/oxidase, partial [Rhodotorula diobovata]